MVHGFNTFILVTCLYQSGYLQLSLYVKRNVLYWGVHSVWDVYTLKALHSLVKSEEGKEYL